MTDMSTLADAAKTVLAGFEAEVFVRNIAHDDDPRWAIVALPYLAALGQLARLVKAVEP